MKSKRLAVATALSVAFLAAACAAKKPAGESAPRADEPAAEQPAKKQAKAPTPAPAGSKLAKITNGMADTDVRRILGEPDSSKNYMTGKAWIPYYYGTDTTRVEYIYHGLGRITLSRNQYTGGLKVIRVDYDPSL